MVVMMAGICMISNFNVIASVSRLVWAFARDKGLPFHEYFTYVSIFWAEDICIQLTMYHRSI
jgi:amino acid transporter